jgi:hypothetical protein
VDGRCEIAHEYGTNEEGSKQANTYDGVKSESLKKTRVGIESLRWCKTYGKAGAHMEGTIIHSPYYVHSRYIISYHVYLRDFTNTMRRKHQQFNFYKTHLRLRISRRLARYRCPSLRQPQFGYIGPSTSIQPTLAKMMLLTIDLLSRVCI